MRSRESSGGGRLAKVASTAPPGSMGTGNRIYLARTKAGISQRELARRIGMSQPIIADYEAGIVSPQVATVEAIARALKKKPAWIAGWIN